MNKTNVKELGKAIALLEEAAASVHAVLDDEQDTFDGRSEKWQESEAGELAQEVLDALQTQIDAIEEAAGELSGAINA